MHLGASFLIITRGLSEVALAKMFRMFGAVVAAYAGFKYGDDLVRLLLKNQKPRLTGGEGSPRRSLQIDVEKEETDEGSSIDSDESSTSLRKSKYSFVEDTRSRDSDASDIPFYERRNSRSDDFGSRRRSRSDNGGRRAYQLDITVHSSGRKRDSLQESERDFVVKESVHVPAEGQAVEPIKKWRRLSMEKDDKVSAEVLRGMRSRFSFEADEEHLADHFRDLSCTAGAKVDSKQSPYAALAVEDPKDPILESEAELMSKMKDAGHDCFGHLLGDEELEEVDCMSEEIYSRVHKEIIGDKPKPSNSSKPNSRRPSFDLDTADEDDDVKFQRWVSLRTGCDRGVVFWYSRGKLYDYLSGEALVNVEALDVTRGVSLAANVMHQLSERLFVFRNRDSDELLCEYKGAPVNPVRHSFSYTWNASHTFGKATKTLDNKHDALKVNVRSVRQPNDQSKVTFNCRISLTVSINQGKFQWHEIGDYDLKAEQADPRDIYRCSMLYMGAIPPLSHIAVMHLSGWRVDDFNMLPASIKDHVHLHDISWIGQPTQ